MPNGLPASGGDVAPDESPVLVPGLTLLAGMKLSFSATGTTSWAPTDPLSGPDGFGDVESHRKGPDNGVSNVFAPTSSLLGVFLGPGQPDQTPQPPTLAFVGPGANVPGGTEFSELAPLLKQVFFIGDGRNINRVREIIVVPQGATRLFLGTMDGWGWYNNVGSLRVDVIQTKSDLVASSLAWDTAQGGVDFGYSVKDAALTQDTTAALYLGNRDDVRHPNRRPGLRPDD